MKGVALRDLILILALYVLVLFGFGWFGGFRAAGKSIEDWGRATATSRRRSSTS